MLPMYTNRYSSSMLQLKFMFFCKSVHNYNANTVNNIIPIIFPTPLLNRPNECSTNSSTASDCFTFHQNDKDTDLQEGFDAIEESDRYL